MKRIIFILFCLTILSFYPIYTNFYYGRAEETYQRHIDFLNEQSQFYNPWQYRVLAPLIIEGLYKVYNVTVDKIYPIEEKFQLQLSDSTRPKEETKEFLQLFQEEGFVKYLIVFLGFRFFINLLIFYFGYKVFRHFTSNPWLIGLAFVFMSLSMGNAVNDADLAFNTYIDVALYLVAGHLILGKKSILWFIPITLIGALNRETSLFIPALLFLTFIKWDDLYKHPFKLKTWFPNQKITIVTAVCLIIFAAIFVGIRLYYGYEEQTTWKVEAGWPMLKLNLFSVESVKSYFEMFGAFSILPFIILYNIRKGSYILKVWFWGMVPVWFLAHWLLVVAYQSRLFLVPTFLIFLPFVIELIERETAKRKFNKEDVNSNNLSYKDLNQKVKA